METAFICLGAIAFFVVLFGFILLMRFFSYRETLALADRGLVRPARERSGGNKAALVWGVIIASVGVALSLGLWPLGMMGTGPGPYPLGLGPWMLFGFIPLFFGLGLILVYVLTRDDGKTELSSAEIYPPNDDQM